MTGSVRRDESRSRSLRVSWAQPARRRFGAESPEPAVGVKATDLRLPRGADTDAFTVKNYRKGPGRNTTTTLATHEFIQRFLHRIRHYGLLANDNRAANLARMRALLDIAAPETEPCGAAEPATPEVSSHAPAAADG